MMKRNTMGSALAALVVLGLAAAGLGCDGGAGVGAREDGLQLPSFRPIRPPTRLVTIVGGAIAVVDPEACSEAPVARVEVEYETLLGERQTMDAELEPMAGDEVVWSARLAAASGAAIVVRPTMACPGDLLPATRSWTPARVGLTNLDLGFRFEPGVEYLAEAEPASGGYCLEGTRVRFRYRSARTGRRVTRSSALREREGRWETDVEFITAELGSHVTVSLDGSASRCNLEARTLLVPYGHYDRSRVTLRPDRVRPDVTFTVDDEVLDWGACTTLRWEVSGAFTSSPSITLESSDGRLEREGLNGSGSQRVCPSADASGGELRYTLRVVDGAESLPRRVDVRVRARPEPEPVRERAIRFDFLRNDCAPWACYRASEPERPRGEQPVRTLRNDSREDVQLVGIYPSGVRRSITLRAGQAERLANTVPFDLTWQLLALEADATSRSRSVRITFVFEE